jgi:hypothetical protein
VKDRGKNRETEGKVLGGSGADRRDAEGIRKVCTGVGRKGVDVIERGRSLMGEGV